MECNGSPLPFLFLESQVLQQTAESRHRTGLQHVVGFLLEPQVLQQMRESRQAVQRQHVVVYVSFVAGPLEDDIG